MKIETTGNFDNQYLRLIQNDQELKPVIRSVLKMFRSNTKDSRLYNHALRKRLKGKRAIAVTDDIRIIYERIGINTVRLIAIGTHKEVYPRSS